MELNDQALLAQVRTAHRLVAAYYQRLHSNINELAKALDLKFYVWEPLNTARPGQLTTNPFERWQWDMLPGLACNFVFKTAGDNNRVHVGEHLLEIRVNTDSGFDGKPVHGQQPDALSLTLPVEQAESTLSIRVYVPYESNEHNWYSDLWRKCLNALMTESPEKIADYPAVSAGFEADISALMLEGGLKDLITRTETMIEKTKNASREYMKC